MVELLTILQLPTNPVGDEITERVTRPFVEALGFTTDDDFDEAVENAEIAFSGGTPRTLRSKLEDFVSVYDFGYQDGDDIAVSINLAIAEGIANGSRYPIHLPNGGVHTIGSTIIPRSYFPLIGGGPQITRLVAETDAPYAQTSGLALYGAGLSGATLEAASGHEDATVLSLTSAVWNDFSRLRFDGFTTGKILKVAGAVITTPDESLSPATTSNTAWNTFRDWMVIGCKVGLELFGKYGAVPTVSPANSAPVPSVVLSKNVYDNLTFWNVTETAIDIIGACDHEVWGHISVHFSANNAVGVKIGSDPAYAGNNYANNHEFPELVFSKAAAETGLKGVVVSGWSFGNEADIKSDISSGFTSYQVTSSSQSHRFAVRQLGTGGLGLTRVVVEDRDYIGGGADVGTLMRLSADYSITAAVEQAISWSTQDVDAFNLWTVGDPTKMVIPADWPAGTMIDVSAGVVWAVNSGGIRQVRILKNGITVPGAGAVLAVTSGASFGPKQAVSSRIPVNPGDYLTVGAYHNTGAPLNVVADENTFFRVRRL